MCFYRNLNRLPETINKILKEASAEEGKVNIVKDIDMNTILSNYQELSFRS